MVEFVTHAPTPQQQQGIDWLCARVEAGEPVSALTGYAGTGKTTVIPHLATQLQARDLPVTLAAPTHRAAAVLRSKGLASAQSLHSACTVPYFQAPYVAAMQWLGDVSTLGTTGLYDLAEEFDEEGVPHVVRGTIERSRVPTTPAQLQADARWHPPEDVLRTIGIEGADFFDHFGARLPEGGVLIIDEASMVDTVMLGMACEVFEHLILIGDPGQLPPVEGQPVLKDVEHFLLSTIHRQAQDSPIVQLAYAVRDGFQYWRRPLQAYAPAVQVQHSYPVQEARTSPLLVFRNSTRMACTQAIRAALGYPPDRPVVGEPLVCRARSARARLAGFYNNAGFRVVEVTPRAPGARGRVVVQEGKLRLVPAAAADAWELTLQDELTGELRRTRADIEELDAAPTLGSLPFRFGYVFTAHTAQGGEWPQVALSLPEARRHNGLCFDQNRLHEPACWGYTAITRAKERVILLTEHHFV